MPSTAEEKPDHVQSPTRRIAASEIFSSRDGKSGLWSLAVGHFSLYLAGNTVHPPIVSSGALTRFVFLFPFSKRKKGR